jgi:hypothetical protein
VTLNSTLLHEIRGLPAQGSTIPGIRLRPRVKLQQLIIHRANNLSTASILLGRPRKHADQQHSHRQEGGCDLTTQIIRIFLSS